MKNIFGAVPLENCGKIEIKKILRDSKKIQFLNNFRWKILKKNAFFAIFEKKRQFSGNF